ncbi:MAG: permease-like cell division protein FtsX, partial [Humibacter sp.]
MRFALVMSEAGSGLKRNLSMVISVVLVTFISLTFVGAAILMQMQIGQMKTYWYDRAQVAVYMCTETDVSTTCQGQDATAAQITAVKTKLQSSALAPFISKFYFENHKQAYADFKKQFKGNPVADYVT